MTWRELKNLINKKARDNKTFLDTKVNLFDFKDGEEYEVNTTELSCGNDEISLNSDTNWVLYLSINDTDEETNNDEEVKEASID